MKDLGLVIPLLIWILLPGPFTLAQSPPADGEIVERGPCSWPFASYDQWRAFMRKAPADLDDAIFREVFTAEAFERYRTSPSLSCERILYGSDGLRVVGYLVRPVASDAVRLPAVIYNRGGYGEHGRILFWNLLEMYDLAARGFLVVASEYRGNWGGEGQDEGGGADVNDVLHLLTLIDGLPGADPDRVGMLGWSRGGTMTYHALARTDRLAAAVIVAGPTDAFDQARRRPDAAAALEPTMHRTPSLAAERLARSPVRWPERLFPRTPLLLLHGAADRRVHPGQVLEMARRLHEIGHPFRFVLFEGGDHQLNEHRGEVWRLITTWLGRYVRDREPWPSPEPHGD
jgi:dipeptidyl aminopeptidase/acylaminoacyl peptidase